MPLKVERRKIPSGGVSFGSGGGGSGQNQLLAFMLGQEKQKSAASLAGEKSAAIKQAGIDVENKQTRSRLISAVNDMDETMAKIPDLSPEFGRFGGIALNVAAKSGFGQEEFPFLAEVETWNGAKKGISRIVARAWGEQRITDLDRDDFIEILNSPESTSQERTIKSRRIKNAVIDLFGQPQQGEITFSSPFERRQQPVVGQSPIPGTQPESGQADTESLKERIRQRIKQRAP